VHHPDVVVDVAAAGCIVLTTGACSPLALGALATTVGTSGYKNLHGSRKNYGRFAADVALGVASFGAGKVVGDVARSTVFVTDAGDRMVLTRVTAAGFLLTDLLLQGTRGELDESGVGGNDK
jgi:hypothetical protein